MHILLSLVLLIIILPGCAPKNFADYRLMEHIEENRVLTLDSDLELLSSLEHHRPTRAQSKKGEQHKRRLRSLFRIFKSGDNDNSFFFSPPIAYKNPQVRSPEITQPGRLRLGILVGHSAFNLVDVWR